MILICCTVKGGGWVANVAGEGSTLLLRIERAEIREEIAIKKMNETSSIQFTLMRISRSIDFDRVGIVEENVYLSDVLRYINFEDRFSRLLCVTGSNDRLRIPFSNEDCRPNNDNAHFNRELAINFAYNPQFWRVSSFFILTNC